MEDNKNSVSSMPKKPQPPMPPRVPQNKNVAPVVNKEEKPQNTEVAKQSKEEKQKPANKEKKSNQKQSKEKPSKEKKQKQPKRKLTKKEKVVAWTITGLVVVIIALIISINVIVKNNKQLETPTAYITNNGGQIVVYTDYNTDVSFYEFTIESKTGEVSPVTVKSSQNSILLEKYFKNSPAGNYYISVKLICENSHKNSKNSEKVMFEHKYKLENPQIEIVDDVLYFYPIENAKSYTLFYTSNKSSNTYDIAAKSGVGQISIDIKNLENLVPGSYDLSIVANPEEYYSSSDLSNIVSFNYTQKIKEFQDARYDSATKTLTFTIPDSNILKYNIKINDSENLEFTVELTGGEVSIDLSVFVLSNSISKMQIQAVGANEYITSTPFFNVNLF